MRKLLCILVLVAAFLVTFAGAVPVSGMTGSGTAGDPYIIWDVGDLQDMENDLNAYYELGADIDATATSGWNGGSGFRPINAFTGNFDGQFYTIDGLYMNWVNNGSYQRGGLFGSLGSGAEISNLIMTNAYVRIYKCEIAGSYYAYSGVLCGEMDYAGGVVIHQVAVDGQCFAYLCSNHHNYAVAGGLIGYTHESSYTLTSSFADVDVTADSVDGGGTFDEALAFAGGLIGRIEGTGATVTISDCYARGDVLADTTGSYPGAYAGGLIGWYQTGSAPRIVTVDNCYATGLVDTTGDPSPVEGGLIGLATGGCTYVTDSVWDTETSGQPTSACGTGKTTTEMQTESTFTDLGWDFTTTWAIGGAVNGGYPYLLWWYTPPGGIVEDIYQVVWFQPNHIIQGTELPNRTGNQDGVIHWGANPAGITIDMEPFIPDDGDDDYDIEGTGVDMVGPTGNPDWTGEIPTLTDHPFYPLVDAVGDQTGIPNNIVWILGATLLLLLAMIVAYRYVPHQIITALIGGSIASFWYAMGIYPFWVIFIFVILALAIIIGERSPTV